MRMTIELSEALFQKAKLAAVRRKVTLKELISDALEKELDRDAKPRKRMTSPPVKLRGGTLVPALSKSQEGRLFEAEDLKKAIY